MITIKTGQRTICWVKQRTSLIGCKPVYSLLCNICLSKCWVLSKTCLPNLSCMEASHFQNLRAKKGFPLKKTSFNGKQKTFLCIFQFMFRSIMMKKIMIIMMNKTKAKLTKNLIDHLDLRTLGRLGNLIFGILEPPAFRKLTTQNKIENQINVFFSQKRCLLKLIQQKLLHKHFCFARLVTPRNWRLKTDKEKDTTCLELFYGEGMLQGSHP